MLIKGQEASVMQDEHVPGATAEYGDHGQSWAVPVGLLKELFLH